MNPTSRDRKEIILLAEAFFEGALNEDQARRLDQLVCEDPQMARLYMEYVELHDELRCAHHGHMQQPQKPPMLGEVLKNQAPDPLGSSKEHEPPTGMGSAGTILGWFGLGAVTLFTCMMAAMALWYICLPQGGTRESLAAADYVAQLTAITDCDWSQDYDADIGTRLTAGDRLSLNSGTIEITHDSGAKVRLEGPAAYIVSSANRGVLEEGDLSACVPPRAIGFVVDTPAGQIIDQGTEFDVKVRKDKKTGASTADVRVIKGAVDIEMPTDAKEKMVRNRYKGGEAVRISSIQRSSTFTGMTGPVDLSKQEDSFDPRTIKGMRLWLRADAAIMLDKQGRISEMPDLVGGSNENGEHFRQGKNSSRPHWVNRGINGRSTMTFTGRQFLQLADKKDLCFYDESLTIFVVGKATDHTQYFISSCATFEKHGRSGFRFTTSRDCGLRYMAGRSVMVVRKCPIAKHNVLSVIHDRRVSGKNSVTLFCNGRQLGEVEPVDDSKIENSFPLTIGGNPESITIYPDSPQNYLHGDLAEIIIYDRVLTELEQQRIECHLTTRYGLRAVHQEGM